MSFTKWILFLYKRKFLIIQKNLRAGCVLVQEEYAALFRLASSTVSAWKASTTFLMRLPVYNIDPITCLETTGMVMICECYSSRIFLTDDKGIYGNLIWMHTALVKNRCISLSIYDHLLVIGCNLTVTIFICDCRFFTTDIGFWNFTGVDGKYTSYCFDI